MKWEKFKYLDFTLDFLVEQHDGAQAAVVLFHGYGADANDLASLSRVYQLSTTVDWYFPQGPLQVPISPMMNGRAWFDLRVSDFEQVSEGQMPDMGLNPSQEQRLNQFGRWLNHLGQVYDKVFIGGFSQGAILTSHVFYRLNFAPAGLLLLSGFLVAPSVVPTLPENLKVPFFQSHGAIDPVLNIKGAKRLFDYLQARGLSGQWQSFHGGHEIPVDVIAQSQTFLNSALRSQE